MSDVEAEPGLTPSPCRAILIGAAGSAGQRFALALKRNRFVTHAVDKDEIGLARLRQDTGFPVSLIDVLDPDSIDQLYARLRAEGSRTDLLINVAGHGYVRTLAMMRASRAFCALEHDGPAYVVNVAAPSERDNGPITYASSEVAFDRLSEGLSDLAESQHVRILTFHRLDSQGAIDDLVDRLCSEIRSGGEGPLAGTRQALGH